MHWLRILTMPTARCFSAYRREPTPKIDRITLPRVGQNQIKQGGVSPPAVSAESPDSLPDSRLERTTPIRTPG
jgi:hypothetical protein